MDVSGQARVITAIAARLRSPGVPAVTGAPRQAGRGRRALAAGAWALGALGAFAAYRRLAGSRAVNSDGAAQALQAWDMLHGNVLLRGWTTSDVSFYTTELPQYLLIELVRGLRPDVVPLAAAMTYTLAVLLAALVAKGTATGREAAIRVVLAAGIMLAPQLDSGTNVLLSSPDHIGTSVPLLAAWLVLDRARPRGRVPVAVAALLALALVADSIVLLDGVIPLAGACALRLAGETARARRRRPAAGSPGWTVALGGGAVVAVGVAQAAGRVIRALGGYSVRPLGTQIAPLGEIFRHNLPIAARCLLLLPGADFPGLPDRPTTFFVALHVAGAAVAVSGIAVAAWRLLASWRQRADSDLVSEVLLFAIAVNLIAFVVTTRVYAISSAREIGPVLPFAAALAGRQLGPRMAAWRQSIVGPALGIVLAGYLAGLGLELTTPAAAPQQARLTSWLMGHHLGTGLSGYWEASIVTLTSGGTIAVRPVAVTAGRVSPAVAQVKASWFDPERSAAHFVVLFPGVSGYPGFTQREAVLASFGSPERTYHVGRYTIWYWHRNLLRLTVPVPGAAIAAGPGSRTQLPSARALSLIPAAHGDLVSRLPIAQLHWRGGRPRRIRGRLPVHAQSRFRGCATSGPEDSRQTIASAIPWEPAHPASAITSGSRAKRKYAIHSLVRGSWRA